MKPSYRDTGLIKDEHGNLVGVNLGWDFTAEHEWGIEPLKKTLGVGHPFHGPLRHRIASPEAIQIDTKMVNRKKWYTISYYKHDDANRYIPSCCADDATVLGAWREDAFVVAIRDKKAHAAIVKAIECGNAILTIEKIFASEGNPFSRGGLKIMIEDTIPAAWRDKWVEAHKDHEKLMKAAEATGIAKRLKNANKKYVALSPRWLSEEMHSKRESAHTVVYWLNPMEQDTTNYGYFTVEELDQWIRNEGPIPMAEKTRNKA